MVHGRKPDRTRRRQIVALRKQGLTLSEIGERLGISKQAVERWLRVSGQRVEPRYTVRCCRCKKGIITGPIQLRNNGPALCLGCLAREPAPTCGQRLRALRLGAGLTLRELGKKSGVVWQNLHAYEQDKNEPKWQSVVRLARVLGAWLVLLPAEAPNKETKRH